MVDLWLRVALIWWLGQSAATAFNLDVQNPTVIKSSADDEYFGFSLSLVHRVNKGSWLMVGAPKSLNNNYIKSGASKKCLIREKKCTNLPLNVNDSDWRKHDMQIESIGTLFSLAQDVHHGKFLSCAPHTGSKSTLHNNENTNLFGTCVWGNTDLSFNNTLAPLLKTGRLLKRVSGKFVRDWNFGEAGVSVEITRSMKNETQFLIGAPNVLEGMGTVIRYSVSSNGKEITNVEQPSIPDTFDIFPRLQPMSLGYSVTSGKYFSKEKLLYASGAPNFAKQGMVLIFDFAATHNGSLQEKLMLNGTMVGEYFGAAITSGDLNNDKLDDLVVGAPLFGVKDGLDVGRVVIFSGNTTSTMTNGKQVIVGKVERGRFGSAVAFLGDLDHNRYGDLAIGAPYEGSGVVYIYYNGPNGFSQTNVLKLVGSSFEPLISGFGFSFSRGVDIDNNGYPDFAVGAYKSGHVVLFKTKPVYTLLQTLKPNSNSSLTVESSNFTVRDCVKFVGHRGPHNITLIRTLELGVSSKRIYYGLADQNQSTHEENVLLSNKSKWVCSDLLFFLKKNITDYKNPLKMSVLYTYNASLPANKLENGKYPPVFEKQSFKDTEVGFVSSCGINVKCIADLHLEMKFFNTETRREETDNFVLGTEAPVKLQVSLLNLGMPAYDAKVKITFPAMLHESKISGSCKLADIDGAEGDVKVREILCPVVNPLARNRSHTYSVEFDFDTSKLLDSRSRALNFSAEVSTNSHLTNNSVTLQNPRLKLVTEAGVTVSGTSGEEMIQFKASDTSKSLSMTFHVDKYGVSPLQDSEVKIEVPFFLKNGRRFMKLVSLKSLYGRCEGEKLESEETADGGNSPEENSDEEKSGEEIDREEPEEKKRKKRELSQKTFKFPSNRTLILNCTSHLWRCKTFTCKTGPMDNGQSVAPITLDLLVDFSVLKNHLGMKDIVQILTEARVKVIKPDQVKIPTIPRPSQTEVRATFKRNIDKWDVFDPLVISLSSICSLLLLSLMIGGLSKAGFFNRKDKEALQAMMKMKRPPIASLKDLQIMYDNSN